MRLELEDKDLEAIAAVVTASVVKALRPLLSHSGEEGERLLDIEEAAKHLGVTVQWLYKRTSLKEIPYRKVGRFVKFSRRELDAWVEREGRMPQVSPLSGALKAVK